MINVFKTDTVVRRDGHIAGYIGSKLMNQMKTIKIIRKIETDERN